MEAKMNRRLVGWIGVAAAAVTVLAGISAVAGPSMTIGGGRLHWVGIAFGPVALHYGHDELPAAGLRRVSVVGNAAGLRVHTVSGATGITVNWGLRQGVGLRVQRTGGLLRIWVPATRLLDLGTLSSQHLDVTIPAGVALTASSTAGSVAISGQYRDLSATAQAGTITLTRIRAESLTAEATAGSLAVTLAAAPRFLSLSDTAGSIALAGPWPAVGVLRDTAGSISMQGRPERATHVAVSVSAGQFTSGFAGLVGGGNGLYQGVGGRGTESGSLSISDTAGNVTLVP
jgi:hypothetical protein